MLMILNLHSFYPPSQIKGINSLLLFDYIREATSIIGPNLFVLLSGYFGIRWKREKFFWLIFECLFFVLIIYGASVLLGHTDLTLINLFRRFNVIPYRTYWFVSDYILLYIMAPVLNSFVDNSKIGKLKLFIMLFFFFQFYYSIFSEKDYQAGYSLVSFMGIYLIGRYIKLMEGKNRSLNKGVMTYVFLSLLLILIIAIYSLMIRYFGHKDHVFTVTKMIGGLSYNNPAVIILSILVFLFFKKIKFYCRIINWVGMSTLSVYLFHRSPDVKEYYNAICMKLYDYDFLSHYLLLLLLFVSIFLIAIPIDKVGKFIFDRMYKIAYLNCKQWKLKK